MHLRAATQPPAGLASLLGLTAGDWALLYAGLKESLGEMCAPKVHTEIVGKRAVTYQDPGGEDRQVGK